MASKRPDDDTQGAIDLGFGADQSGLDGQWKFVRTLGQGSFGHAGLWSKEDGHGGLGECVVVKESYLEEVDWDNPAHWYGRVEDLMPKEAYLLRQMSNLTAAQNIVGYRSHAVYAERFMQRLYMEYCPHGDLKGMLDMHHSLPHSSGGVDKEGKPLGTPIPEPVLWSIFEALAANLCLMKNGALPDSNIVGAWASMVHLDIKNVNIFLSEPQSDRWRGIPVAKLGDFDLGWLLADTRIDNPENLQGSGGHGFAAPEQYSGYEPRENHTDWTPPPGRSDLQFPMTSASDVFAVGCVMHSLMELKELAGFGYVNPRAEIKVLSRDKYSPSLVALVEHCKEMMPDDRIDAVDLWRRVHNAVTVPRGVDQEAMEDHQLGSDEVLMYPPDTRYINFASGRTAGKV